MALKLGDICTEQAIKEEGYLLSITDGEMLMFQKGNRSLFVTWLKDVGLYCIRAIQDYTPDKSVLIGMREDYKTAIDFLMQGGSNIDDIEWATREAYELRLRIEHLLRKDFPDVTIDEFLKTGQL